MTLKACSKCEYGMQNGVFHVDCRRYAPMGDYVQVNADGSRELRPRWPVMNEDDWCGEFEPQGGIESLETKC